MRALCQGTDAPEVCYIFKICIHFLCVTKVKELLSLHNLDSTTQTVSGGDENCKIDLLQSKSFPSPFVVKYAVDLD